MTPIYLDYNATTPLDPAVVSAIQPFLSEHFGNPSSTHAYGQVAHAAVERARGQVAALLGARPEDIVFTGGEATLRNDLPELIAHAESNGQITGLNTNARRLADEQYVQKLVDAGLDHVQITVESCDEQIHDEMMRNKGAFKQTIQGLKNVLATQLYVMTNTTMLRTNVHKIPDTLDFLAELGVPTIGLNALIYAGQGLTVGTGLHERELQPSADPQHHPNGRRTRLATAYGEREPIPDPKPLVLLFGRRV